MTLAAQARGGQRERCTARRTAEWLAAVLVALLPGASLSPASATDSAAYLTPPYGEIVQGHPVALDAELRNTPAVRSGAAVGFFLTREGRIRTAFCDAAGSIPVVQPTTNVALSAASGTADLAIRTGAVRVEATGAAGGIASFGRNVVMGDHVERGVLVSRDKIESVSTVVGRVGLTTAGRSDVAVTQSGVASQATRRSSVAVQQETRSEGVRSRAGAIGVRQETARQELKSRLGEIRTARSAVGGTDVRAAVFAALLRWFGGRGGLASLVDSNFLSAIADLGFVPGFTGADGQPVDDDEAYEKAHDEWDSLAARYDEGTELLHYLDGLLTARFRREWKHLPSAPHYEAAIGCDVVPRPIHHGAVVGLMFTLRNTGNAPLFDALVLNGVPEHATYLGGPERAHSYSVSYVSPRRLVLVRLFRPLLPGETFRTMVVVRMDPWLVEEAAAKGMSRSR